jgi:hypothetical protein
MSSTLASSAARCQANSPALDDRDQDKELVLLRTALREAIEESGVKKESVAAAMGLPDPAYLSKLFSGEKMITARHIVGLPNDVERIFDRKRAEQSGFVCIEPVDDATADRYLAIGLFARLSRSALPMKTAGPIKVDLHAEKKSRTA